MSEFATNQLYRATAATAATATRMILATLRMHGAVEFAAAAAPSKFNDIITQNKLCATRRS